MPMTCKKVKRGVEVWLDVAGYEGLYQVSSTGLVKSMARYGGSHYKQFRPERLLKASVSANGYPVVGLCKKGKARIYAVHRLVALAFVSNPDKKPQVNHKDGDKTNNHAWNLEWVTGEENSKHAERTGLLPAGEKNHAAKLTALQVLDVYNRRHGDETAAAIASMFGVDCTTVYAIWKGRSWTSVTHASVRTAAFKPRSKGRFGDSNGNSKLSEHKVRLIRRLRAKSGLSSKLLAKKFGVCVHTIRRVLHKKFWKDVED